jgi:hypothetical protein
VFDDQDQQEQHEDVPENAATDALSEDLEPSDEQAEQVSGGHAGHNRRRRPPRHH